MYYVEKGDTLFSIGQRFGVPWQKILEDNACSPTGLEVGQVLLIPIHLQGTTVARASAARPNPAPAHATENPGHISPRLLHRGRPSHAFWWPTGGELRRRYGDLVRGLEEPGIGIAAPAGTDVCAVASGTVICCVRPNPPSERGWGNVVAVRHARGIVSWYGRLKRITVREGEAVRKGERIGTVGATGAASEPGLAFRMFRNERPIDPLPHLP